MYLCSCLAMGESDKKTDVTCLISGLLIAIDKNMGAKFKINIHAGNAAAAVIGIDDYPFDLTGSVNNITFYINATIGSLCSDGK